jgi:hypothetical protein
MRMPFNKVFEKLAIDIAQLSKPLLELDDVAIMAIRAMQNQQTGQSKLKPIKQDRPDR